MGSKKHKKESKKKKHRSRSRSPVEGEERERKRHRKHKDRKKDRSPDIEEVPVDSHLKEVSPRSNSAERDRQHREARSRQYDDEVERESVRSKSPSPGASKAGGAAQESLSVEETNRLRIKLGLKPLEVKEKPTDDGKFKDDLGEFYHKPATNISQQKKADKLREKLEERKEKRKIEQKLQTKTLADESDDEDAIAWVQKSRELQKQKQEAAKRAAMLDEMDEVFGVSALVAEEEESTRAQSYNARHLESLRVAHDFTTLDEERDIVLTLADKPVLGDDTEDVLVNVNIADDEKAKKNIVERKKARAGYQAYDDEADFEALALGFNKPVLGKYDEEIDPQAGEKQRGFRIGDQDAIEASRFKEMMYRERLQGGPGRMLESLSSSQPQLASQYYSQSEMEVKFKKVKKKGKMRKKPKQEAIDVDEHDAGNALITDDTDVKLELLSRAHAVDDEEVEPDAELQNAIARALRTKHAEQPQAKMAEFLPTAKEESLEAADDAMVLDATAEFCRSLGDIPTYGQAPNRDQRAEIIDFEEDMEAEPGSEPAAGAWSRVDTAREQPPHALLPDGATVSGLEAEPAVGTGVAGALRLALSKGYLERAAQPAAPRGATAAVLAQLAAPNYSIDDKAGGEEEKGRGRDRGYCGPLQDFREKTHFRPLVKLDYVDDDGRPLRPKEAFRYLSHKFHGKGPGKNKQEKRLNKANQEALMKKMSSTDTPLNTLQMLQDKQKETQSPYIVLSGSKRDTNN